MTLCEFHDRNLLWWNSVKSRNLKYMSLLDKLAGTSLLLLCLFYCIMLGGGNYEQLTVAKVIVSNPPKSFAMLIGEYPFTPIAFWAKFRALTIVLFVLAIVFNWRASPFNRKILLVSFGIDILITISTFLYFAPEVGAMISSATANEINPNLAKRVTHWHQLNYVRLGAFYLVAILLLVGLKRSSSVK